MSTKDRLAGSGVTRRDMIRIGAGGLGFGLFGDPSLNGFPESRPEATDRALKTGQSMGIEGKPSGNRPLQPVSDRFFYWLRATALETRRVGYWWANRMLQTAHPLRAAGDGRVPGREDLPLPRARRAVGCC